MLKYYLDRDGDLWATDGDKATCVADNVEENLAETDGLPFDAIAQNYGPLSELKAGGPVYANHSEMTA